MTITRPLRLMILHFSQIFLTEGLTFMFLPLPVARRQDTLRTQPPVRLGPLGARFLVYQMVFRMLIWYAR